ncbi:MAG TPA: SMP-30/gluconolactonase/LRE family protein [Candidatus Limnocylindrales bacterium]|nr:SMP-30/gluconolactonase/LRE family protein [Candidatus Limnocylindrales bacterium]
MMNRNFVFPSPVLLALAVMTMSATVSATAGAQLGPYATSPDAAVDLSDPAALAVVGGEWRYADAAIEVVAHRSVGADLKASGAANRTHDISPRAGTAGFDDSGWPVIEPQTLLQRRGNGRLSFGWYRLRVTLPGHVARHAVAGSTVVLEVVADDYAEVWVDGELPAAVGQSGGSVIAGFNTANRVVLTRDARPGQTMTAAIFVANGPLSDPPANFVWLRSATLEFYGREKARAGEPLETRIERNDAALDAIVAPDVRIEKVAAGFEFIEGPVWTPDGLLFSDPNANRIYRWSRDGQVSLYRTRSGYAGLDIGEYRQPGSNGLALDGQGRLTICEHGNRRVTRIEKNGVVTTLADSYEGKRLNSPNDLVYRSDGALCFTDPPFGLPRYHDDPRRELGFTGVFCLRDGRLELVSDELSGPNGINFSPDESHLYVTNWDPGAKTITRFSRNAAGGYGNGELFFDMTSQPGETALDGLEVDELGNLYVAGPGGLWILSAKGEHLGTIQGPELPANFAFGDDDRKTLYITAHTGLYRLRLKVPGRAR